jgi:glycosyltransferase involved in cell wall biosynthesis
MRAVKKRILIVNTSTKISGAETSLLNTLGCLSTAKYRLHIILPDQGTLFHKLSKNYTIRVFKVKKLNYSKNPLYILKILLNIIIQTIRISVYVKRNKIDLLYSNSMYSMIYSIFVKKITKVKHIAHLRDNITPLISKLVETSLVDSAICVSDYISQQLKSNSKKITIHNGINSNEWYYENINKDSFRIKYNILRGCKLVVHIGQIVKWKNHEHFVLAAKSILAEYENVHFLIVGSDLFEDNTEYFKKLKKLIVEEGLVKHITFLGYIEDIKEVLQNIDILIHTALQEPFGRVILEAMLMQKPVVAYNIGGPKEIITNEEDGFLVEAGEYEKIADKCIELLNNPDKCTNIGIQAKNKVVVNFSILDSVSKFETVLDEN